MILFPDLNLVVIEKAVHEGKDFMFGAHINDLMDEGCWEVVFGTCLIQAAKVCTNADGTLFFIHGNMILNPCCVSNGVNDISCVQLLNLDFDRDNFGGMDWTLFLVHGDHIGPCVDVEFHNGWIQHGHSSVGPDKYVT